jgi:hypothetical protein
MNIPEEEQPEKKAGIDKYTSAAARVDPRRYLPAMEWDSHPKTRK